MVQSLANTAGIVSLLQHISYRFVCATQYRSIKVELFLSICSNKKERIYFFQAHGKNKGNYTVYCYFGQGSLYFYHNKGERAQTSCPDGNIAYWSNASRLHTDHHKEHMYWKTKTEYMLENSR